jgi:hypothetical protein
MSARRETYRVYKTHEGWHLEIRSAARARNDGTFDTTVIWAINSMRGTSVETGMIIKLCLEDVAKIQILKDARCVFDRSSPS